MRNNNSRDFQLECSTLFKARWVTGQMRAGGGDGSPVKVTVKKPEQKSLVPKSTPLIQRLTDCADIPD